MSLRPIRLYPDPVLRVHCPEVTSFDDGLRRLAADMIETMHAAVGVGLAAPQIGVETRLMVVDPTAGEDDNAVLTLVNPVIDTEDGGDRIVEGCLSIPGFTEKVDRPTKIHVHAQNLELMVIKLVVAFLLIINKFICSCIWFCFCKKILEK